MARSNIKGTPAACLLLLLRMLRMLLLLVLLSRLRWSLLLFWRFSCKLLLLLVTLLSPSLLPLLFL